MGFTKKDLKSGMTVELRNGRKYLFIADYKTKNYGHGILAREGGGFQSISSYCQDLTCVYGDEDYDIMRVYEPLTDSGILTENKKLIYDREDENKKIETLKKALAVIKEECQHHITCDGCTFYKSSNSSCCVFKSVCIENITLGGN
ncbi:MAG: hypothetical protein ACLRVU_01100 [Beduini sp.]|uniref:hypothetical protein n=1 Tax=Beduini sp. TaxID=1922300 RepID=UPI00399F810A